MKNIYSRINLSMMLFLSLLIPNIGFAKQSVNTPCIDTSCLEDENNFLTQIEYIFGDLNPFEYLGIIFIISLIALFLVILLLKLIFEYKLVQSVKDNSLQNTSSINTNLEVNIINKKYGKDLIIAGIIGVVFSILFILSSGSLFYELKFNYLLVMFFSSFFASVTLLFSGILLRKKNNSGRVLFIISLLNVFIFLFFFIIAINPFLFSNSSLVINFSQVANFFSLGIITILFLFLILVIRNLFRIKKLWKAYE